MDWGGEQGKLCAGRGGPDGSSQVPQESLPTWHGLLQAQVALSRLCSADREDRGGRDKAARQGLLWAPPVRWSPSLGASCLPCPSPSPPQCVPALPTVLPLCPRRRPGWARLRLPVGRGPWGQGALSRSCPHLALRRTVGKSRLTEGPQRPRSRGALEPDAPSFSSSVRSPQKPRAGRPQVGLWPFTRYRCPSPVRVKWWCPGHRRGCPRSPTLKPPLGKAPCPSD